MVQFTRLLAVSSLLALSTAAEVQAAGLYSTKCGDLTGAAVSDPAIQVANVRIVARPGKPPKSDTRRREHVGISGGLAAALGISADEVGPTGESPQVRITLPGGSPVSTAVLTVDAIDATDPSLRLAVWRPEDVDAYGKFGDTHNGFFKLFGSRDPEAVFSWPQFGVVHGVAPGTTVVVEGGVATRHVHFAEPNASKELRECVELRGDDRVAVLVPHGGGIETRISDAVPTLLSEFEAYGYEPSVWEAAGQWGGGSTFERWHVTGTKVSGDSFPGFGALTASGDYQYSLALHGFVESEPAVVFGGQASRQVKCFMVYAIEYWLEWAGQRDGRITYKIFAPDGPPVDVVRRSTGAKDKPKRLTGVNSLDGSSPHNVVNRLWPNPSGKRGFGGIQLEVSGGLRSEASLFRAFVRALAYALVAQIELEPVGDFCAQYE